MAAPSLDFLKVIDPEESTSPFPHLAVAPTPTPIVFPHLELSDPPSTPHPFSFLGEKPAEPTALHPDLNPMHMLRNAGKGWWEDLRKGAAAVTDWQTPMGGVLGRLGAVLQPTLGAPVSAISRAVTTAAGLEPTASLSEQAMRAAKNANLGKWGQRGAFVGGLAADIALDPLTYTTFGAEPAYRIFQRYLRSVPDMGHLLKDAEIAGTGSENFQKFVHGRMPRPENVKSYSEWKVGDELKWARPDPALGASRDQVRDLAFVHKPKAFQKLVDLYRDKPELIAKDAWKFPMAQLEGHGGERAAMQEALDSLAQHMAHSEHEVIRGYPAVRMGWGANRWEVPGSKAVFEAINKGWDDLRYGTQETTLLPQAVRDLGDSLGAPAARAEDHILKSKEIVRPGTFERVPDEIAPRFQYAVQDVLGLPSEAKLGDVALRLAQDQVLVGEGKAASILVKGPEIEQWLLGCMGRMAKASRPAFFDSANHIYHSLAQAAAMEPISLSATQRGLAEALASLETLRTSDKFWNKALDFRDGERVSTVEVLQREGQRLHQQMLDMVGGMMSGVGRAAGSDLGVADVLLDGPKGFKDLEKAFHPWQRIMERLATAKTSPQYSRDIRGMLQDAGQFAERFSEDSEKLQAAARAELNAHHQALDNVLKVGMPKVEGDGGPAKLVGKYLEDAGIKTGAELKAAVKTPAGLERWNNAKQALQMHYRGKAGAAEVEKILKNPEKTMQFIRVGEALMEAAKGVERERAVEIVLDEMMAPLAKHMDKSLLINNMMKGQLMDQLGTSMAYHQAVMTPNHYYKYFMNQLRPAIDQVGKRVWKTWDVVRSLSEVMRKYAAQGAIVDREGRVAARQFTQEVREGLREMLPLDHELSPEQMGKYLMGVSKVDRYIPSLQKARAREYAGEQVGEALERQQFIEERSEKRIREGIQLIQEAMGDAWSRPLMDEGIKRVNASIKPRLDDSYGRIVKMGIPIDYKENYLNYQIIGPSEEVKEFWEFLKHGYDLRKEQELPTYMAVKKFAPAEIRKFEHPAEVEWEIERVGRAKHKKFNLKIEHHIEALMMQQGRLEARAKMTREMLADLRRVLPEHVVPAHFQAEAGSTGGIKEVDKEVMAEKGFQDLGEIIPSLKGWYVSGGLHKYLEMEGHAGLNALEAENIIGQVIRKWLRASKRFNILVSPLFHLKNMSALAATALANPKDTLEFTKYAFDHAHEAFKKWSIGSETAGEYWRSPLEWAAEALMDHPEVQEAMRANTFPFRGQEVTVRPSELIDRDYRMWRPGWWSERTSEALQAVGAKGVTPRKVGETLGQALAKAMWMSHASETALFDLFDMIQRMSLTRKFKRMGMGPHDAADMVNYHMIDYSMRDFTPELRKLGYMAFPFFAWDMGNWRLHPAQMLRDPRPYRVIAHMMNDTSDYFSEQDPAPSLRDAIALPLHNKEGYQEFIHPDLPSALVTNPARTMMDNPLDSAAVLTTPAVYVKNKLWTPYKEALELTSDETKRRLKKYGWGGYVMGTPTRSGVVENTLWGAGPLWDFLKAVRPSQWQTPEGRENILHRVLMDALGMGARTQAWVPPEPGKATGHWYRENEGSYP